MKEATDVLKIVGMILLALFVLAGEPRDCGDQDRRRRGDNLFDRRRDSGGVEVIRFLDIKSKIYNVPLLHDVVLAFQS
jgi:hypothetical protein